MKHNKQRPNLRILRPILIGPGGWCYTPRLPFGEVSGSLARRAAEVVAFLYFEAAQHSQRAGGPPRGGAESDTSHLAPGVTLTLGAIPAPCNELQLLSSQIQQLAGEIRHQSELARLNAAEHGIDRGHLQQAVVRLRRTIDQLEHGFESGNLTRWSSSQG